MPIFTKTTGVIPYRIEKTAFKYAVEIGHVMCEMKIHPLSLSPFLAAKTLSELC